MKNRRAHFYILMVLFVVVLSQITCNLPQKEEAIQPPEEAVNLSELSAGVFDLTATDQVRSGTPWSDCPQDFKPPQFGPVASFAFDAEGLTLTTLDKNHYFQRKDPRTFCSRDIQSRTWTCIEDLSETGYVLTVRYDNKKFFDCYKATYQLTSTINELSSVEVVNEVPEDENDAQLPVASDDQSQSSEITLDDCLVAPSQYQAYFNDFFTEESETGSLCRSTYTLSNRSDESLVFKSFYVIENTEERSEQWLLRNLDPDEELELGSSYKSTGEIAGKGNFSDIRKYTKVIVFINSSACNSLISEVNETYWIDYAVELYGPCNE